MTLSLAALPCRAADTGGYGSPAPAAATAAAPAAGLPADVVRKMSDLLLKAPAEGDWQVKPADLAKMIADKKTDFLVIDARPEPPGQMGGKIPGALFIPYNKILTEENLKRLPRNKKLIIVCMTGQLQNLPVLPLRALGYDAYTLKYGHASWIKGYFGANLMQQAIAEANFPTEP